MIDWILFGIIVILQGLDVYTTNKALMKTGNFEGNKLIARLMQLIGVFPALILVKVVFLALLAAAIAYTHSIPGLSDPVHRYPAWCVIIVGYLWVVINNFRRL